MIDWKHSERLLPWLLGVGGLAWYFEIGWLLFVVNFTAMILLYFSWPKGSE